MPVSRYPFCVLFFLLLSNAVVGQQKYPTTLLWKISGKNLTKPSYLYGTMHVQDRRLFYFGDSLYQALEKTEGFAMEINPDEMMDSLYKSLSKKDTSALLKKILDENEYKRIAKKLEKKLNIPADKITAKQLADEKRRWAYASSKKDDMPTMMDLYLFSIARKQGKYVSGIEDLADQFEIADELGTFKIDDFIKDDTNRRMINLEEMKQTYLKRDLNTINRMVNGALNDEFKDLFLIKRNIKMALRIDSLSNLRSSFFAIGAAHLPGDSGVINLLQRKGYTLEPVFSSTFIAPELYKYTAKEVIWQTVEDENKMCTVEMPGLPSSMVVQESLPMKMYMDLSDFTVYGIAVTPLTEEEAKSDSIFIRLEKNYKRLGFDIKSVKNIDYKNCRGVEMYGIEKAGGHFRNRFIVNQNKLFIIIYGAKNKEPLYEANADKYLASLSFNAKNIEGKNQWLEFTSKKNAFTVSAPGKIIEGIEKDEEGTAYDKYTAVDYKDGSYYLVIIRDTKPGFFIQNDSLYFDEYKKNLNQLTNDGVKDFTTTIFKGYKTARFTASQTVSNSEFILQGSLIRRGNRTYIPMVVSPKEKADFPNVTNFFRSFTPLPFIKATFKEQVLPGTKFSTQAPGKFEKIAADTTAYDYNNRLQKYQFREKNAAANYSVEIEGISPYYWNNNDSVFFRERANTFKQYNDSLVSYNYINGAVKSAEVLIKLNGTDLYKKLKFMLNGDTVYTVYAYLTAEDIKDETTGPFFTAAGFSAIYPTTVFTNKAAVLFTALQSNDSVTVSEAKAVLKQVNFTKNDLPLLYKAVSKKYKNFENDYQTINESIADEINKLTDSSVVDFVKQHYALQNDTTEDTQMLQLHMLAKNKTAASYALLKNLLLNHTPVKGEAYNLIRVMEDSIDLVKGFFPEVTKLYGDTIVGGGIAAIGNELLDSNQVLTAIVLQNEIGLRMLAKKQFGELKKDKDAYPSYCSDILELLGKFNSKESNAELNKFVALPVFWIKDKVIITLLKNNQPVLPAEIKKIAADKSWRSSFYQSLKEIKKAPLFPKEFYTQQKFAESYMFNSFEDDYEVETKSIQFLKEKTAIINGKPQRFFLYKVILDDEDDKSPHLVVCGAFSMNKAIAEIEDGDLDVYYNYDELPDLGKADEQFKKYIEERIKNAKED